MILLFYCKFHKFKVQANTLHDNTSCIDLFTGKDISLSNIHLVSLCQLINAADSINVSINFTNSD